MAEQAMDINSFLSLLSVHIQTDYTEEQLDFIKNFRQDNNTICFASPGTGKTASSVGGLLTAELFYKIPGNKIYALSFTRMATGELAARHSKACKKLGIRQTVNFRTLHSICTSIIKENADRLNMKSCQIVDNMPMQTQVDVISGSMHEWGEAINEKKIPNIVRAIRSLNSSLTFDRKNVEDSSVFKRCEIDYETFDRIRGIIFTYSLLTEQVQVGDIMLYTLLLLTRYPEISDSFKENCSLMLVDEAQDLSLLQLKVISLLASNAIIIGDNKQSIYSFQGASQEIVSQFYKLFDNVTTCELTQSFRCKNEIAKFANSIIIKNQRDNENMFFAGTGEGGTVDITNTLNLDLIIAETAETYLEQNYRFTKDYLYLFRNNASAVPVAEKLFKAKLPFRVNHYTKAYDLPVIQDLVKIALLAKQPDVPKNVEILSKLINEFSQYRNVEANPLYKIMTKTGYSVFEINYQYKNQVEASEVFDVLNEVRAELMSGETLDKVFNMIYPMYYAHWLKSHEYLLEFPKDYYISLVQDLLRVKNLDQFIQDENEKEQLIKKYIDANTGIRCYTMHAAKGLEADVVYILDADDGILPNNNKLRDMVRKDCPVEAAREIRNERSLCYVAATRARESLIIQYRNVLSPLYKPMSDDYDEFDEIYKCNMHTETDIEAFDEFARKYVDEVIQS